MQQTAWLKIMKRDYWNPDPKIENLEEEKNILSVKLYNYALYFVKYI